MENLQLTHVPQSKTGMLIRKPVAAVFTAFVDPAITTKFWFTKGSGLWRIGIPMGPVDIDLTCLSSPLS